MHNWSLIFHLGPSVLLSTGVKGNVFHGIVCLWLIQASSLSISYQCTCTATVLLIKMSCSAPSNSSAVSQALFRVRPRLYKQLYPFASSFEIKKLQCKAAQSSTSSISLSSFLPSLVRAVWYNFHSLWQTRIADKGQLEG